ncbi:MAG: hypothetical protein GY937_20055 [bacterium]|nr:hypothetical protein [bacterium]
MSFDGLVEVVYMEISKRECEQRERIRTQQAVREVCEKLLEAAFEGARQFTGHGESAEEFMREARMRMFFGMTARFEELRREGLMEFPPDPPEGM